MKKILIIEDQEDVREVAKTMLEMLGYEVVLSEGPQQGVDLAVDNFDLVLIDIMMPIMDGFQVLAKIKKNPLIPKHTKFVAFTARSSGSDIKELVKKGFDDYIIKPFTYVELKGQMIRLLS